MLHSVRFVARFAGKWVSKLFATRDDELFTVLFFGLAVMFGGIGDLLGVTDAIGAFVIGLLCGATRYRDRIEQLAGVRGAVAASGTVSLQLAALAVPQVVVARTDPWTWAVGREVVRTPWVALPNVLAGRCVVSEHVQHLDPAAIVRDLLHARAVPLPELHGAEAYGRMAAEIRARLRVAP